MQEQEEKAVAFYGKITAGITHEFKNVLAIIKESSGLIEDILSMSKDVSIPYLDKIENSLSSVQKQVKRGVDLSSRLNWFAHCTDNTTKEIDLQKLSEEFVGLAQRFARLKHIVLKIDPVEQPDQALIMETKPVHLLMVLFECVNCCMNVIPEGSEIYLHPYIRGEKPAISIICRGDGLSGLTDFAGNLNSSDKWPDIEKIIADTGGSVDIDEAGRSIVLLL